MCEDFVAGEISTYREYAESEAQKGLCKVNQLYKYAQFHRDG